MQKPRIAYIAMGIIFSILIMTTMSSQAFAEVISLYSQKTTYAKGEGIVFYGQETQGNEEVSVILRNAAGEFITLRSDMSNEQGYFQTLAVNAEELLTSFGTYTATAISNDQNERNGKTITIDYTGSIISRTQVVSDKLNISTAKSTYLKGETVQISGQFPVFQENTSISLVIRDPSGIVINSAKVYPRIDGTFSYRIPSTGDQWWGSGIYSVTAQYMSYETRTSFNFVVSNTQTVTVSNTIDNIKPLVLVPDTIYVTVTGSEYARVPYSVTAIDNKDGMITPKCTPSQNYIFPIGQTRISCIATDSAGNREIQTFLIVVTPTEVIVPSWVKEVADYWCSNRIDDANFADALQYLIRNEVIDIPPSNIVQVSSSQNIPVWVKNTACWWSEGQVSDVDFVNGIQYLISRGIITV